MAMVLDGFHHPVVCVAGNMERLERAGERQQRAQPTRESDAGASDVRFPQHRHSAGLV